MKEEIYSLPELTVNGVVVGEMKYDKNMKSYTYDYEVKDTDTAIDFSITGYTDKVGNVGTLTNADINDEVQNSITIDNDIPVLKNNDKQLTNGNMLTGDEIVIEDVNFDYAIVQNISEKEVEVETELTDNGAIITLPTKDDDNARYYIVAYDKAGNHSEKIGVYRDNVKARFTDITANIGEETVDYDETKYYEQIFPLFVPVANAK